MNSITAKIVAMTPEELTEKIYRMCGVSLIMDMCIIIVVAWAAPWWMAVIVFAYALTTQKLSREITALRVLTAMRVGGRI